VPGWHLRTEASKDVGRPARLDAMPAPKEKSDRPGYSKRMLHADAQTRNVHTWMWPDVKRGSQKEI
jgi:hypothetical protein